MNMLNWMLRTWWVQAVVGVVFSLGLTTAGPLPWDLAQWALVVMNLTGAASFFFGAGALWAARTHSAEDEAAPVPVRQ